MDEREIERLNLRALNAIRGYAKRPESAIAALLGSDAPIFENVRIALFRLFDGHGEEGLSIKISGHAKNGRAVIPDSCDALAEKHRLGKILRQKRSESNFTREQTLEFLSQVDSPRNVSSTSYADKAISYSERCDRWVEKMLQQAPRPDETDGERRQRFERLYHRLEAEGMPVDRM